MNKYIYPLLAIVLVFSLTACTNISAKKFAFNTVKGALLHQQKINDNDVRKGSLNKIENEATINGILGAIHENSTRETMSKVANQSEKDEKISTPSMEFDKVDSVVKLKDDSQE